MPLARQGPPDDLRNLEERNGKRKGEWERADEGDPPLLGPILE